LSPARRLLVAGLAVLALAAAWGALRPEPSLATTAPAARRPLWSPDRLPALLAEAQGTVELEQAVDELLSGLPSSCLVVHQGQRPVLVRRPNLALTPASTQKLLVGAAALRLLGPDFRFETKVVASEPPRQGVVGALWLVGAGDPFLATPGYAAFLLEKPRSRDRRLTPLAAVADGLVEAGVRAVPGGVRGDDSRYDRLRLVPTWKPSYIADNEVGPLGALVVDGGFEVFTPPEARAADPAAHAASELALLAAERGIDLPLAAGSGVAPADGVTLAEVRSARLSEIVAAMVRESDNLAAELLVRELGRRGTGDGSTPAGTEVVVREIAAMGLPVDGLRLADGSGLEVTNKATCALLGDVLRPGRLEQDVGDWMAVAGRSGTLAKRLVDTPLQGKLAAKTGSLKGVTGLAGFVDGRRRLSFALLATGFFSEADGRLLQDRVVALLANYPGPQPEL
jgi:serine-type D-Ala-D-Ala carboxypeptidase/endopeptidase (penicillin-binding protein 4)